MAALRAGDLAAAERLCGEVLARMPAEPNALNLYGAVEFARGNYVEAERLIARALAAQPKSIAAQFNLGRVYQATQRLEAAAEVYASIFRQSPRDVEALVYFGIVRYEQSRLAEAAQAFETVLNAIPEHQAAALNLAIVYNHLGRFEDSVQVLRRILATHPDFVDAYRALADSLYELHRADESAEASRAALARSPDDPQALVLLGQAECERGAYEVAEGLFRQAAAVAPERPEAEMNLGVLLQRLGRVEEAIEHGRRAVALAPGDPLAHFNLAMAYLLAGDFERGWPEFEWRVRDRRLKPQFPYLDRLPMWDGEPMRDRDVLIALEQGLGDFILVSRLLPQLQERGIRVVLETPPELAELYANFPGVDEIVVGRCERRRVRSFAAHLPVCSLPFVSGLRADAIPSEPYLRADPALVDRFRERFDALGDGLKVGIVWAGSAQHLLDRFRSCRLTDFDVLRDVEGVDWVSLQKGSAERQLADLGSALRPLALGPELNGFDDTAAAIEALDLVIAVDTSVAHLAGAMGKPIWTLHGFGSYWVWQLERSDSPWYPTMRLFRQQRPNSWAELFADVRAALRGFAAAVRSR